MSSNVSTHSNTPISNQNKQKRLSENENTDDFNVTKMKVFLHVFSILDWPKVDAVILSEFGSIDNVPLCIAGTGAGVHSCQGRCNETKADVYSKCRCDPECLNYGDCCYDYEIFIPICNDSLPTPRWPTNFSNEKSQNTSWSNYLNLIETLDHIISSEHMHLVFNRSVIPPGYDCVNPSLTPSNYYYFLVSR